MSLKSLDRLLLHEINRAASKPTTHHSRPKYTIDRFSKFNQLIQLFTAYFILILQAIMRGIYALAKLDIILLHQGIAPFMDPLILFQNKTTSFVYDLIQFGFMLFKKL
jgi:hypothetical protein